MLEGRADGLQHTRGACAAGTDPRCQVMLEGRAGGTQHTGGACAAGTDPRCQVMHDADGLIEVHDPCGAVRGAVVGADSASLSEGTVVRAADGAVDVVVAVADGEVDQA